MKVEVTSLITQLMNTDTKSEKKLLQGLFKERVPKVYSPKLIYANYYSQQP
jgi:hypothetical protein